MRTILACTGYWHSEQQFNEQRLGRADDIADKDTGNLRHHLRPEYKGLLGFESWLGRYVPLVNPVETIIACGTWSDPSFASGLPVRVVNAGVEPVARHDMGWQYMGCALTALFAAAVCRHDWDFLVLAETDMLPGAVNWPNIAKKFMASDAIVAGPAWFGVECDHILWKRAACAKFLHQRFRPNLTLDKWKMFLDYELDALYKGQHWNPWPDLQTVRFDFWHEGSPKFPIHAAMNWPFVRQPAPEMVEAYLTQNRGIWLA